MRNVITRRTFLGHAGTVAAATVGPQLVASTAGAQSGAGQASAASSVAGAMETRAIPSSGERIPVIGMGTSGSFEVPDPSPEFDALREVMSRFVDGGGTVIDTAPTYGPAEDRLGVVLAELKVRPKAWIATKLSGVQGRDAGLQQFNRSLARMKTDKVELLQVHNLGDLETQLALARELKSQGKTRYVGVTHYLTSSHDSLVDVVRAHKPDFLQINYSVVTRGAEARLLPLSADLGVAVLINRAFEDGKLFSSVKGKELPGWAAEAGITSWAQAFLRFALSVPAVTCVIPATGKPDRQTDNLKAGHGARLTDEQRLSLIATVG